MANFAFISPTIWAHDLDLSGFLHKATVATSVAELDNTTFGSGGYHSRIGGLRNVDFSGDGYWDGTIDSSLFSNLLGSADRVVSICSQGAETNIAYIWQSAQFQFDQFGAIGVVTPFALGAKSSNAVGLIRSQMASAKRSVSGTGQVGSILTLAGPSATQFVYCAVHVFSVGTSITLQLQSATTLGFAGPTTRATIGPLTVVGGTWMTRVAGAITDGFWRVNCSAVTGTFSMAASIGVQ